MTDEELDKAIAALPGFFQSWPKDTDQEGCLHFFETVLKSFPEASRSYMETQAGDFQTYMTAISRAPAEGKQEYIGMWLNQLSFEILYQTPGFRAIMDTL